MIDRDILENNLRFLLENPEGPYNLDKDGKSLIPAQEDDPRVQRIIEQTFEEAAALEPTKDRIWIKDGEEDYSLGHALKSHPAFARLVGELPDEKREFITLTINGHKVRNLDLHYLKVSSTVLNSMLADLDEMPLEICFNIDFDATDQELPIRTALHYFKGKSLPYDLPSEEYIAILKIANFFDAQELLRDCLKKLQHRKSENALLDRLPIELLVSIFKSQHKDNALSFIKDLPDKHPLFDAFINQGVIQASDFPSFDTFLDRVNTEKVRHLNLAHSKIRSEDLEKTLKACPNLNSLDLSSCTNLGPDALQYLVHTPNLQSLNLSQCSSLGPDALKYLENTRDLQSLNLSFCNHFSPDTLEYLRFTQNLKKLDLSWCNQLPEGFLHHLEKTRLLTRLNLMRCDGLSPDDLQHLHYTQFLTHLNLMQCENIGVEDLKYLENTPRLIDLNISWNDKLAPDSLENLRYTPRLRNLNIDGCTKLRKDSLRHLERTPDLKNLSCKSCMQLDRDSYRERLSSIHVTFY